MKKKISLVMVMILLGAVSLWARPGYSKPVDVLQPDGSTVTLLMHGDEFLSFMTTIDGYTVIKGSDGYYRYADKTAAGGLRATSVIARNPEARSAQEVQFLAARQKMTAPTMTEKGKAWKAQAATLYSGRYEQLQAGGPTRSISIWSPIDYSNFKGLVVLINWNDCEFTTDDPANLYLRLTNERNLTGNVDGHYPVNVSGSARDYFYDNSLGKFDPEFDVVGPYTINYSCKYPAPKTAEGKDDPTFDGRLINILKAAMNAANPDIDFNQYDMNSDGVIDMVYFIFAGYGSYVQGNDYHYLWPHANDLTGWSTYYGMRYDSKKFGRYACSVEIQDYEDMASSHVWLDGIGTICHEFSHVLGLADHYDTDYEENGYSDGTGAWDVMAGGADYNYGLTPVGYNAFERHVLEFTTPTELSAEGNYTLGDFLTTNESFILKTGSTDDDFYLENRQPASWDTYLPGHGLLVWRADTSKPSVWRNNTVNNNPDHLYFEMVCNPTGEGIMDLTETSTPALTSWAGQPAVQNLYDIKMEGGTVSFTAGKNVYDSVGEDFETAELTTADATVSGKWCNWDLVNAVIASTAEEGVGNGEHVLKMLRTSTATSTTAFDHGIRTLKFTVKNGSAQIRFSFMISTDGGSTWTSLVSNKTVARNKDLELFQTDIPAGSMIRFQMLSTSASACCYIDDIVATFYDNEVPTPGPLTGISTVLTEGETLKDAPTYDLAGRRVAASQKGIVIRNGKKMVNK